MPAPSTPAARPATMKRWRRRSWSARTTVIGAIVGACLAGGASYAATTWTLARSGTASGGPTSAPVTNLTVSAVAAPTPFPADLLYPGASGDIAATITNPNAFPVTVTAVRLPSNSTYATGYTYPSLSTVRVGCSATTPSGVTWAHATSTNGSTHTLTTPINVAANSHSTITLIDDAAMGVAAPPTRQNTYFVMPPLIGLIASAGATSSALGTTDSWTS